MLYALSLYSDEINYFSVKLENRNGSTLGAIMAVKDKCHMISALTRT